MTVEIYSESVKVINIKATGSARINIVTGDIDDIKIVENIDKHGPVVSSEERGDTLFIQADQQQHNNEKGSVTIMLPASSDKAVRITAYDDATVSASYHGVCFVNSRQKSNIKLRDIRGEMLIETQDNGIVEISSQSGPLQTEIIAHDNSKVIAQKISSSGGFVSTADKATVRLGDCHAVNFKKNGYSTITVSNKNELPTISPFFS